MGAQFLCKKWMDIVIMDAIAVSICSIFMMKVVNISARMIIHIIGPNPNPNPNHELLYVDFLPQNIIISFHHALSGYILIRFSHNITTVGGCVLVLHVSFKK